MCPFRENLWGCCRIWTWKRWWVCVCVFDYLSISLKLFHIAYITIMIYYEYIYTTGRPQDMFSSICAARSNWVGAGQWISMLNMQMTCLGWWCSKDPSNENSGGSELWVVIQSTQVGDIGGYNSPHQEVGNIVSQVKPESWRKRTLSKKVVFLVSTCYRRSFTGRLSQDLQRKPQGFPTGAVRCNVATGLAVAMCC